MRRFLAVLAASTAVLVIPASAPAKVVEIGETPTAAVPSCPGKPCLAVSKTTGYQAKVGDDRGLMLVPSKGRIVAWTIALAKPSDPQIKFFETNYGGPAQAGLTILRPGKYLHDVVKASGPLVPLTNYFGGVAQFPLETSIPVRKGDLVALTVPTWVPALQVGLPGDTSWRAARGRNKCKAYSTQTSQLNKGDKAQYYCLYRTARLAYSATLITNPRQINKPAKSTKGKQASAR